MTRYVPPRYKSFTFHIHFHTQTHLHIRTYFTTTSNKPDIHQNTESSPQGSLPFGQQTLTSPTNNSDTPSQDTPPQGEQPAPVKTNINLPTQPSISDEETQQIPKSTNGNQVKCSKPQPRQKDEHLCFFCNQLGHLKRNCSQLFFTAPDVEPKDIHQINVPTTHSETDLHVKLLKSTGINGEGTKIFHNSLIETTDVFTVQEIIKLEIVQHDNGKPQPLTTLLLVQVLQHMATHLTHHITHPHNLTHSHHPAINTVNPLCMFKHLPSTLMLHIFSLTYTMHKITNPLTIIHTNNKFTHHQHNHLIHIFHNSTHRFHHCNSHNAHLLAVHL